MHDVTTEHWHEPKGFKNAGYGAPGAINIFPVHDPAICEEEASKNWHVVTRCRPINAHRATRVPKLGRNADAWRTGFHCYLVGSRAPALCDLKIMLWAVSGALASPPIP